MHVIGPEVIIHDLYDFRQHVGIQCRQKIITIQKSDLMTDRMNDLIKIVETRKERILKELCK